MLNLSRLDGGLIAPKFAKINLHNCVLGKVKSMQVIAAIKKISLNNFVDSNCVALSDENILSEILEIFISNAIKHCPEGSTVNISCENLNSSVNLCVEDSDGGFNQNLVGKIDFAPSAPDPNKNTHGLGLYMASKYAALIGAEIVALNGVNYGAVLKLIISKKA